jgi:hypothetical protein
MLYIDFEVHESVCKWFVELFIVSNILTTICCILLKYYLAVLKVTSIIIQSYEQNNDYVIQVSTLLYNSCQQPENETCMLNMLENWVSFPHLLKYQPPAFILSFSSNWWPPTFLHSLCSKVFVTTSKQSFSQNYLQ